MLHHYTTVNTLAQILRHKTLRFTRLDQFDDVTEGRSLGRYPAGTRLFASCWSGADQESIPQWAMYGDAMRGVRLSLKHDPFIWHPIDIRWHENFQFIGLEGPFTIEEMLREGIILIPSPEMRKTFGQRIKYVSDVDAEIKTLSTENAEGGMTIWGEGSEVAFFKSENWAFQEEFRYVLQACPGPKNSYQGDADTYLTALRAWLKTGVNLLTGFPDRHHVDLKLDPAAIASAVISVGPLAPAGTKEVVEALVATYAPGATVRISSLAGMIRPR